MSNVKTLSFRVLFLIFRAPFLRTKCITFSGTLCHISTQRMARSVSLFAPVPTTLSRSRRARRVISTPKTLQTRVTCMACRANSRPTTKVTKEEGNNSRSGTKYRTEWDRERGKARRAKSLTCSKCGTLERKFPPLKSGGIGPWNSASADP